MIATLRGSDRIAKKYFMYILSDIKKGENVNVCIWRFLMFISEKQIWLQYIKIIIYKGGLCIGWHTSFLLSLISSGNAEQSTVSPFLLHVLFRIPVI